MIGIYAFLVFILENFAHINLSRVLKLLILVTYCASGMAMYVFRSNLVNFTRGSLTTILSREDALVLVFCFLIIMFIPTAIIFIKLGKFIAKKDSDVRILNLVRYFILGTLLFSIFMMALGGYPNFGMSVGFDMYQILYGSLYIYVFYKLFTVAIDIILCRKTKFVVIRSFTETVMGGVKRADVRYW
ncbi:hypothetical protein [Francisella orientalis]|uniref:hypothetical protein n=1 Tax=Francisella orientalis TaxID=299583 RepID=UPI0011EF311B|nr:hypothetical protein [Francisella orientalis]MBK2074349.1 hypothetical protein [Francisella orientalis]MBK2077236.1 hypothetical protein [Francisella orientalis]MBK2079278.1 hypothetical protein [Francisella orientalis]MBK2081395.1 hypothetical protein [Francisella orientalis]MBK2082337.1 hypothetical protein [Francisella orientalis]